MWYFRQNKLGARLLMLTGLLALASCARKPPVTSDFDVAYDFSQLKTYSWVQPKDPNIVSTLDSRRQANAIETILNRKGFSKVKAGESADFLLKTHTITDKKVDVDRYYNTWGYYPYAYPYGYGRPYGGSSTVIREKKIGTLVLDIVDPTKKQVIWRGSVAEPLSIYNNRTPEERASVALTNAEAMLVSFPPQPGLSKEG